MNFFTKLGDLFYKIKDAIEDFIFDLKEKIEKKLAERKEKKESETPADAEGEKTFALLLDKRKIIAIVLLLIFLISLVACVKTKHDKSSGKTGNSGSDVADADLEDPDAWWKKYSQGDAEMPGSKLTKANEISWSPVDGAVAYNVYRADEKDGDYICIAVVTETKYTDTTAENGKKYYYKTTAIKAVKEKKNGTTALVTREVTMAPDKIKQEEVTVNKKKEKTTAKTVIEVTDDSGNTVTIPVTTDKHPDVTESTTDSASTTESTTKETTTETTTQRVIPSSAAPSTRSTRVNNAATKFNANAATEGITTQQLATLCGQASGVTSGVAKTTNIKALKTQPTGYDECYKFTADYSVARNSERYFGYVFKVSEGTNPAEFAQFLSSNAVTSYSYTGIGSTKMNYKATAYYDQYVFFMVSYN